MRPHDRSIARLHHTIGVGCANRGADMTTLFEIQSACECQAILEAELDEQHQVLAGWSSRAGTREPAPANSVGADRERFDVVWHCPMCGRNVLRTFYAGALSAKRSAADEEAGTATP